MKKREASREQLLTEALSQHAWVIMSEGKVYKNTVK